jgi:nucleoid-associated protein YgaU
VASKPAKLKITPRGADSSASSGGGLISGLIDAAVSALGGGPSAGGGDTIEVPFNPKEYTIEQSNTYAEIGVPGLEAPILQFVRGNTEKLSFDLLIDTTELDPGSAKRDARIMANKILQLARVDGERHAPPICKFEWGGEVIEGVIESVRRQFLLFDQSGIPTRITLSIGVKRYRSLKEQLGTMNRRSPDRTRTVVVVAGDTLPAIAFRAYGDDTLWRPIAEHNQLADPARLVPGTVLELPKVEAAP